MSAQCTCLWFGKHRMRTVECERHGIADQAFLDQLHAAHDDPQHRWPKVCSR